MQATPPATAATDLSTLRRRLSRWELGHLRQHCADLAQRLEADESHIKALEAEIGRAWDVADGWRDNAQALIADLQAEGKEIGLTTDGQVLAMASADQGSAAVAPSLATGERYAGIVLDADGRPTHHLILLPQRPSARLNWDDANAWAASTGGALPSRQEQALLYANCKPHLQAAWYWSSDEYEGDASYAWDCNFFNGNQYDNHKSLEGTAVAVRRLALESFNPFAPGGAA